MLLHKTDFSLLKFICFSLGFVSLILIWGNPYFITNDGPMHVYNSNLFLEWLRSNPDFPNSFLDYNPDLDPTRLANWLMTILLTFFNTSVVEKIIATLCVLGLPASIMYILNPINAKYSYMAGILVLPFSFNICLMQGFYNYLLGVVLMCVCIGYYSRIQSSVKVKHWLIFCVLIFIMVLSHALPYYMLGLFLLCKTVVDKNTVKQKIYSLSKIGLAVFPAAIILFLFNLKQGHAMASNSFNIKSNLLKLFTLSDLNIWHPSEPFWNQALVIFLCLLLFIGIIHTRKNKFILKHKEFLLYAFALLFVYLFAPDSISGVGAINLRFQFLTWVFFIVFGVSLLPQTYFRGIALVVFVWFVCISFQRKKVLDSMSRFAQEFDGLKPLLDSKDVVLTYHFNDYGQWPNEQSTILTFDNSLMHLEMLPMTQSKKPILSLNNYQARNHFFLFSWKPSFIPFNEDGVTYPSLQLADLDSNFYWNQTTKIILANPSKAQLDEWTVKNQKSFSKWHQIYKSKNQMVFCYGR